MPKGSPGVHRSVLSFALDVGQALVRSRCASHPAPDLGSGSAVHAEGWYKDPFGLHDARWFSDGRPTELVRDGRAESHDPPPDRAVDASRLEPAAAEGTSDPDDLRRADDYAGAGDGDAVWEPFDRSGGD